MKGKKSGALVKPSYYASVKKTETRIFELFPKKRESGVSQKGYAFQDNKTG